METNFRLATVGAGPVMYGWSMIRSSAGRSGENVMSFACMLQSGINSESLTLLFNEWKIRETRKHGAVTPDPLWHSRTSIPCSGVSESGEQLGEHLTSYETTS